MPGRFMQQAALWAAQRKLGLRFCLLSFSTLMPACEVQMQAPASSPFALPAQGDSTPAAPPADLKDQSFTAMPAALAKSVKDGLPATPANNSRSTAPPMVAPIPLRGQLDENIVYEGLLDPYETQLLVRALEASNRDAAPDNGSR